MKHLTALFMLLLSSLFFTGLVSAQEATTEAPIALEGVNLHDFEIDLGAGFTTKAQLTTPLEGDGPFPTVILFHGSGPFDMDATYTTGFDAVPLSSNFRLMAERLGQNGIAVLRFNKRGVNALGDYDAAQVQASTLDRLVADAEAVLSAAQEQAEVDPEQIYLYGWSEGAWVAANTAAKHPDEVAGLILQGTPQGDIVHILQGQQIELMIPYLAQEIDADEDGALTLEEVSTIPTGPVQYSATFYLYDQTSTPDSPKLNAFVDANHDNKIDIEAELTPMVTMFLGNYPNYMPSVEASYDVAALLAESEIPTLLLHGAMDGWVPLADAEAIAEAVPETVTLNVYPDLGHALSETEALATDAFGGMDDAPLADIVAWIGERS